MAGGGVAPGSAQALLATGVDALHASCGEPAPGADGLDRIGILQDRVTSVDRVRALRREIERLEVPA